MSAIGDVKDILRGVVATLTGFAGRVIARAAILVIAGRVYGIEAVGRLGEVAALSEIIAAICVFGLNRSLLDMLSFEKQAGRSVENRALEAPALSALIGLGAGGLLSIIWWQLFPGQWGLVIAMGLVVPATVIMEVCLTVTKFRRIIRWDVLTRCLFEPWSFLFFTLLFWWLGWMESGLILAYIGSVFVSSIAAIIGMGRILSWPGLRAARPTISTWPMIFKTSLPVGLTEIGVMALRRIDLVVLALFVGPEAVGLFYMAQQIVTVPHKVGGAFQPMLEPVFASLHNQKLPRQIEQKLSDVCRWIFKLQFIMTIPILVYADGAMGLFGREFAAGGLILAIILIAELIDGTFHSAETPLVYAHPKVPPVILFLTLLIEVILIALLAHIWGVMGAAIGFLITLTFLNAARVVMVKRLMAIQVISRDYLIPLAAGLLAALGLTAVRFGLTPNPVVNGFAIAAAIIIYGWIIFSFGMTKSDRILLRRLRRRKRPIAAG